MTHAPHSVKATLTTDVLILGGGLSGLHTAYRLEQLGIPYLLAEARPRLGGRILTRRRTSTEPAEGFPGFDLGPAWFWPGQRHMESLIEDLGLAGSVVDQFGEGEAVYEDPSGQLRRGHFGVAMLGSYRLRGGIGQLVEALRASVLAGHGMESKVPGTSQQVPGTVSGSTAGQVPGTSQQVPGTVSGSTSQQVPGTSQQVPGTVSGSTAGQVPGTSQQVPGTVSGSTAGQVAGPSQQVPGTVSGSTAGQVAGTSQQVPGTVSAGTAGQVPGTDGTGTDGTDKPIRLGWRGETVEDLGSRLRTTLRHGDGVMTVISREVVVAFPPRLAERSLRFVPQATLDLRRVLRSTPTWMAGQGKCVAVYDRPFWRRQGLSGDAISHRGPLGEIHDISTDGEGLGAFFGFFALPPSRRRVAPEVLQEACVAQLARLFGDDAGRPLDVWLKDWAFDDLTATAADRDVVEGHSEAEFRLPVEDPWHNRILWSGSETASAAQRNNGYLEGALEASERTVGRLMERLSRAGGSR